VDFRGVELDFLGEIGPGFFRGERSTRSRRTFSGAEFFLGETRRGVGEVFRGVVIVGEESRRSESSRE